MEKVLNIVSYPYLPFFSGGQKLIAHFNEYLGEQCSLHVAGTADNDATMAKSYVFHPLLRKSKLRYADPGLYFRIKKLITEQQITTVIIEHPYLGWLGWMLKKSCKIKLIVHTHNIEYERFRTVGKNWWPLLKFYELWVLNQAHTVFCISEEDRTLMTEKMKIEAGKCILVPYGINQQQSPADKAESKALVCSKHGFDPTHKLLLFNGLLDYKPNLDALKIILEQINPQLISSNLKYTILITGKRLPAELDELKAWNNQHIFYAGFVEDIDLYFKAADLFLNPVQSGGGVKTKMIESIALGTTVLSTETGAAGIDKKICADKLLTVADNDWNSFTNIILDHYNTNAPTPEAYYQTYFWGNIIRKIIPILS
ncbi:MAG: glycosyltransferase family 4 protein [Chitinophagaceae bacterium]|nr:glycosyltransferase family 4 protein [Chitinophagaceae bacterium]